MIKAGTTPGNETKPDCIQELELAIAESLLATEFAIITPKEAQRREH